MANENPQVYHEKQRRNYCLLHCLNNLFQERHAFTVAGLDAISDRLTLEDPGQPAGCTLLSFIFKPHHTVFLGDYDVGVLMRALQEKGKNLVYHDHRHEASSIDLNAPDGNLMGIVLNMIVPSCFGFSRDRHWVALRKIGGVWYNLDSNLASPEPFSDADEVFNFLDYVIALGGEVLLVMNEQQP